MREKELGSIVNLYVTPVTRFEFLLGKQIPYVVLALLNFLLLTALVAVFVFRVPLKGSLLALAGAALLYVIAATALGLVISTFMRSQIAALFGKPSGQWRKSRPRLVNVSVTPRRKRTERREQSLTLTA